MSSEFISSRPNSNYTLFNPGIAAFANPSVSDVENKKTSQVVVTQNLPNSRKTELGVIVIVGAIVLLSYLAQNPKVKQIMQKVWDIGVWCKDYVCKKIILQEAIGSGIEKTNKKDSLLLRRYESGKEQSDANLINVDELKGVGNLIEKLQEDIKKSKNNKKKPD